MAKKFKAFIERAKPKKRPRRHKKNLNKSQKKIKRNIKDKEDNGKNSRYSSITNRCS